MFHSARIKLTFWYLLIIAAITVSFSAIIYRDVAWELERGFMAAEFRLRGIPIPRENVRLILENDLADAKKVVLVRLFIINGIILVSSGFAGYFLAGMTLGPIKIMLDEQKRFVADASHELRTPLTSLKTEIEVALRDSKLKTHDFKKLLTSNLAEVDKMKYFTDNLLALSRYEANDHGLVMEKVDLVEAISMAIERNLAQAKSKKIIIDKKLEPVEVWGNPQSLVELVSILINNAIKYSEKSKSVSVVLSKGRRNAMVDIKDQGMGIAQQDIPHIFDRFYRADASRSKTKIDGYGLGLSIAKSIVDVHHGEIKVESVVGQGSTFKVVLPI